MNQNTETAALVDSIAYELHRYEGEWTSAERTLSNIAALIADQENGEDV